MRNRTKQSTKKKSKYVLFGCFNTFYIFIEVPMVFIVVLIVSFLNFQII